MNRRLFLGSAVGAGVSMTLPRHVHAGPRLPDLPIASIVVQEAKGRRLTPVARNAYADYRGYNVAEKIVRIRTANGVEGIAHAATTKPELLQRLIGIDAVRLFAWAGDRITGPAPEHAALLHDLRGADVALLDLIGKAQRRPAHALLGKPVRDRIAIYDSSLYMEDLLSPAQRTDVAYLAGVPASLDPVRLPAIKAEWILRTRPEGFRALKIKIGRSRWMPTRAAALQRDIAVTHAIRSAVGPDIKLMVDANKDYATAPDDATRYAQAVQRDGLYLLEEMFPETQTAALLAMRRTLRAAGDPVKLAHGESHARGIPDAIYRTRVEIAGTAQPLIDIEQADMNANGFLALREKAAVQQSLGMTMAPHNFGSRMGLYAMAHLAMIVPNWEICELDDSSFPAIEPTGIQMSNGSLSLGDLPGLGVLLRSEHLTAPSIHLD